MVGCLKGNGNYLERILGDRVVFARPELASLRPLVEKNLSQKAENHHTGFAIGHLKAFDTTERPKAKKVLYVLRCSLTGTHLLTTGKLEERLIELRRAGLGVPTALSERADI